MHVLVVHVWVGEYTLYVYVPERSIITLKENIESFPTLIYRIWILCWKGNRNDFLKLQLCWEHSAALYLLEMTKAGMFGLASALSKHVSC